MGPKTPSTKDVWTSPERVAALRRDADEMEKSTRAHTTLLLDAAGVTRGSTVLDVACGPGDPTLAACERVGTSGRVTGIDLSEGAVEVARERAANRGIENVTFRAANVEALPFPASSFDRVVSRFGAMFFEDLSQATGELARVLAPGGRLGLMVWGPRTQPYFEATVGLALEYSHSTELPPDRSLPFRFDREGPLEGALRSAGYTEVTPATHSVPWVFDGSPEEVRDRWRDGLVFFRSVVDRVPETSRARFWEEVADRFRPFYDGTRVTVPETVRVVTARRAGTDELDGPRSPRAGLGPPFLPERKEQ